MKVKGSMMSEGEIQIDGVIEGDVKASALTVGIPAKFWAKSSQINCCSWSRQRIDPCTQVQLASSAKVEGDITHASLSIEADARFEGHVRHSDDPLKAAPPAPTPSSED